MNKPSEFSCRRNKDGSVVVFHHGRAAASMNRRESAGFLDEMARADDGEQQEIMARLTGNYKRGNERRARSHFRNRD